MLSEMPSFCAADRPHSRPRLPTLHPKPQTPNPKPLAAAQHGSSANHHNPSDHHPATSHAPAGFYISSFDEATGARNDDDEDGNVNGNGGNGVDLDDAAAGSRSDGGGPPFDRQEDFEASEASLGYGGGAAPRIGENHQAAIPDLLSAAERGELGLWASAGNHIRRYFSR